MRTSQFVLGIVAGAIAGASAVLLSTPQTGNEFRSSLKSTSLDFKGKLSDVKRQLQEVKNSIESLTKESKEIIPQAAEDIKTSFAKWQSETAPIQQQLQSEIASIQQALEELEKFLPKSKET